MPLDCRCAFELTIEAVRGLIDCANRNVHVEYTWADEGYARKTDCSAGKAKFDHALSGGKHQLSLPPLDETLVAYLCKDAICFEVYGEPLLTTLPYLSLPHSLASASRCTASATTSRRRRWRRRCRWSCSRRTCTPMHVCTRASLMRVARAWHVCAQVQMELPPENFEFFVSHDVKTAAGAEQCAHEPDCAGSP